MLLKSFKYKTPDWKLTGLNNLLLTNLLVGVNASGKSRTIRALIAVVSFMLSKPYFFQSKDFSVELTFAGDQEGFDRLLYAFSVRNGVIMKETLKVDDRSLIRRSSKSASLKHRAVSPPDDKLVAQIRRDKMEFPEIESLMKWAEGVTFISFSALNPFTNSVSRSLEINPILFSELVESFNGDENKAFIKDARSLGYNISKICVISKGEQKWVEVKEPFVKNTIDELLLSNGMLRVLYLLAFIIKMKANGKRLSLLLIDDLGEGLDYKRAKDLSVRVFEACEENSLQLITSSNDGLIMDVVDLSKWHVLRKSNSRVSAISQASNPDLFEEFRFTGLSNFDFFSSDFINSFLDSKK